MINVPSPSSENKVPTRLVRWLRNCLGRAGNRLFASSDRGAAEHGWQVTRRHGGLSRRYRDPRFDSLISCPCCHGSGKTSHGSGKTSWGNEKTGWGNGQARGSACPSCQGSGRLIRGQPGPDCTGSAA